MILYNQVVPADTTLEFTFDTEIKYDLLNASHIRGVLNGESLVNFFTKENISLRGSYIVESAQLYVGMYRLD